MFRTVKIAALVFPVIKPNCSSQIVGYRYYANRLRWISSNTFAPWLVKLMVLCSLHSSVPETFGISTISEISHSSLYHTLSMICFSAWITVSPPAFNMSAVTLSRPGAYFKSLIAARISFFKTSGSKFVCFGWLSGAAELDKNKHLPYLYHPFNVPSLS